MIPARTSAKADVRNFLLRVCKTKYFLQNILRIYGFIKSDRALAKTHQRIGDLRAGMLCKQFLGKKRIGGCLHAKRGVYVSSKLIRACSRSNNHRRVNVATILEILLGAAYANSRMCIHQITGFLILADGLCGLLLICIIPAEISVDLFLDRIADSICTVCCK